MNALIRFFISLRVVVICLALLMVLVLWGTLYQVEYGLWAAQERFFYSWMILLFGFLPFPGAQSVMLVLFLNLTVSMVYRFQLGWKQAGLVLIHLGLMLLLAGGAITHQFGEESFLSLAEGEGANVAASYRDWELSVWSDPGAEREVTGIDAVGFAEGTALTVDPWGVAVKVETYFPNCRAFTGGEIGPDARNSSGIVRLESAPRNQDPQSDVPGALLTVGAGDAEPQRVRLYGGDRGATEVSGKDGPVYMQLRRKRHPLPVFVKLTDFRKTFHPGTQTPESFSSLVEVQIEDVVRDALVEMNQPLRYQGYTLYQASYADLDGGAELSTFAVTRNYGRLIPYVATALTVLGLVVHFLVEMMLRRRAMR